MAMKQAIEESTAIIDELATRYMTNKYSLHTVPPAWSDMKDLAVQDAVDTAIRMITNTPFFRSEGMDFAKRILAGLEATSGSADSNT